MVKSYLFTYIHLISFQMTHRAGPSRLPDWSPLTLQMGLTPAYPPSPFTAVVTARVRLSRRGNRFKLSLKIVALRKTLSWKGIELWYVGWVGVRSGFWRMFSFRYGWHFTELGKIIIGLALLLWGPQLYVYLKNRMLSIVPNLTYWWGSLLVGKLIGARLIAHAGSLMILAKHLASTVQIWGAEKALFKVICIPCTWWSGEWKIHEFYIYQTIKAGLVCDSFCHSYSDKIKYVFIFLYSKICFTGPEDLSRPLDLTRPPSGIGTGRLAAKLKVCICWFVIVKISIMSRIKLAPLPRFGQNGEKYYEISYSRQHFVWVPLGNNSRTILCSCFLVTNVVLLGQSYACCQGYLATHVDAVGDDTDTDLGIEHKRSFEESDDD